MSEDTWPEILTVYDTWGAPCAVPNCEERRTIGLVFSTADDDGEPIDGSELQAMLEERELTKSGTANVGETMLLPVCQQHAFDFLERVVFAREFSE